MPAKKIIQRKSASDKTSVKRNAVVAKDSADKYHKTAVHHAKVGNRFLNMHPPTVGGQMVADEENRLAMKAVKKRDKFDKQDVADSKSVKRAGIKRKS